MLSCKTYPWKNFVHSGRLRWYCLTAINDISLERCGRVRYVLYYLALYDNNVLSVNSRPSAGCHLVI